MNKKENNLKINNKFIIDGIIELFEQESSISKAIKDLIQFINKIILIGIAYFIVMCILQKNPILTCVFAVIFTLIIFLYVSNEVGKITYYHSKKYGGMPIKIICIETPKNTLKTSGYNLNLMKEQEIKLVKEILKVNNLYNIECIKEIKNYLSLTQKKDPFEIGEFVKQIINIYLIPITFGTIGVYTSINLNLGVEQDIVNIGYIVLMALIVLGTLLIWYIISKIKRFSISESYIKPCLIKILTEILIEKKRNNSIYHHKYNKYKNKCKI